MNHASLFSGIGGPEIAAAMLGWENVFHCEIQEFPRKVLQYWFPKAASYENIKETDFKPWRGKVDVLSGGFPCQPFSFAGQRRGAEDDRYLWPEMLRCVKECRPTWVVGENVVGLTTMVFPGEVSKVGEQANLFGKTDYLEQRQQYVLEGIIRQLEDLGYSVQAFIIPACAVGALHRRDRIFIVANADGSRLEGKDESRSAEDRRSDIRRHAAGLCGEVVPDASDYRLQHCFDRKAEEEEVGEETGRGKESLSERSQPVEATGRGQIAPDSNDDGGCQMGEQIQSKQPNGTELISSGRLRDALRPERRWQGFPTVSPVHRGVDGIPIRLDNLSISFAKWRNESLKAYGNAIVPQVIYTIFKAIDEIASN